MLHMSNYRRARTRGGTYFSTVVTAGRLPLLASDAAIRVLRESVAQVRRVLPFTITAWVVLPDHMHAVWKLPDDDADFSTRWGRIKAGFTQRCDTPHDSGPRRYAGIWQSRFWEHRIRDERDLAAHVDYVHFNPVKHGYATRVIDWPYSTFHRLAR